MKISLYVLTILFCLSCCTQNKLEEISIQLDKETLNPVRNPGEKGTLRVTGHYSNGKTSDLLLIRSRFIRTYSQCQWKCRGCRFIR